MCSIPLYTEIKAPQINISTFCLENNLRLYMYHGFNSSQIIKFVFYFSIRCNYMYIYIYILWNKKSSSHHMGPIAPSKKKLPEGNKFPSTRLPQINET